jgi:hypothetical protein
MDLKRLTNHVLAAMVIAAWASGCTLEEPPGDQTAAELEAALPAQPDELADPGVDSAAPPDPFKEESVSPANSVEWELRPERGAVMSGQLYSIFNTYIDSYVRYGEREYGINLVWSDTAPNNVALERQGGGTINYGEPVAMRITDGGYVRYQSRKWGINLVWSSSPHYEWEIYGGSGAVPSGTRVRLYNTVEKDDMIYCPRWRGINLTWADDCVETPFGGRVRPPG